MKKINEKDLLTRKKLKIEKRIRREGFSEQRGRELDRICRLLEAIEDGWNPAGPRASTDQKTEQMPGVE